MQRRCNVQTITIANMYENVSNKLLITDLPDEIIEEILSDYFTYHEIGQLRLVCKKFDAISKDILNSASKLLVKHIYDFMNQLNASLPAKESKRRRHPHNKHLNVLKTMHFDFLRLIQMYSPFVKENLCCFIAGKVMDESIKIINLLDSNQHSSMPHFQITEEFVDLCSMALKHFKETVQPSLQIKLGNVLKARESEDFVEYSNSSTLMSNKDSIDKQSIQIDHKMIEMKQEIDDLQEMRSHVGRLNAKIDHLTQLLYIFIFIVLLIIIIAFIIMIVIFFF